MQLALNVNVGHYKYDIFVSFAEEDGDWVRNVLQPEVEGRWGYRLCLHYRDFHPGKQILDNIKGSVDSSRWMMFVFSPHFARSRWCQFELSLGLGHAMNRDNDILVVYLTEVAPEDMTAGMAAILRSSTYLQWMEPGRECEQFWHNLRAALPNLDQQQRELDVTAGVGNQAMGEHCKYDLFVSYAEEDGDWVHNILAPEVEERWGVKLCLHYRDIHPGTAIFNIIKNCMDKSLQIMFVFSPHFAQNRWCQLELSRGLVHAQNQNSGLLVVYLAYMNAEDLTPDMAAILRSCTCLRWAEQGQEVAQFWMNLRVALPNIGLQPHADLIAGDQPQAELVALVQQPPHPHVGQQPRYEYDVFVSYDEEDGDWVRNVLQPVVEGRWGVRLCLHYRDFQPGKQILDNIECCVEGSRRMMFVFSPHFAHSRWCQFELSLGLDQALSRDDYLLVVYLTDVAAEDMTAGMAAILRSCTYLQWAEEGQEAVQFWNSLRVALPRAGKAGRHPDGKRGRKR
jgi:toll-like receptor 13